MAAALRDELSLPRTVRPDLGCCPTLLEPNLTTNTTHLFLGLVLFLVFGYRVTH